MAHFTPQSTITSKYWLFPLSLVLFEFASYIAHDMIQPGMLLVTSEFNVGPEWVSSSLTGYLIGGMLLQWLLGPLSDKYGRRPVMLSGVSLFILACALMHWTQNIEQFFILRILQGISLCFIGAVGYAAIQESFEEALAVRITALMANVALLAPLIGPLAGAAFLTVSEWRNMFWLFALLALVAFFGLLRTMPETAGDKRISINPSSLAKGYLSLVKNRQIMSGSLAIGMVIIPILTWVGLSPVILIQDAGMTRMDYALFQVPVFVGMIAGNLTLSRLAGRLPIEHPVRFGAWPILLGTGFGLLSIIFDRQAYICLTIGLTLYAFGAGMVNAALYRLTLFSSDAGKGRVAAVLGMVSIAVFTFGIEITKHFYFYGGTLYFSLINFVSALLWFVLISAFLRERRRRGMMTEQNITTQK